MRGERVYTVKAQTNEGIVTIISPNLKEQIWTKTFIRTARECLICHRLLSKLTFAYRQTTGEEEDPKGRICRTCVEGK